ncbi:low-density lipoprotein receptor-related protein 11 isoform X2 [Choloepus didactylus]|uniref:low-density lipoprotein receptor-related protein 11 isoform X2 n=1 Tax=Choloepus didactylus TaxID=27675 RepID=UPI00189C9A4E|nr:low-density lipoprotein receptor-related protein 11 isoform X2 [Choloepus didactylus]
MASATRGDARSGRRRPSRLRALRGLLLLCLWLPRGRGVGPPSLLRGERGPRGAAEGCPGGDGGGYRALPGAIIRPKASLAAGARFLRAPTGVRDGRQCAAACCSEPRCSLAVLRLPRPPAAALGCYLFDCTARGRSVCTFAPHRGYTSYSLRRAAPGGLEHPHPDASAPGLLPLENDEPPLSQAGQDVVVHLPADGMILDGHTSSDDHAIVQYKWTLLQGDPSVDMEVPGSGKLKLPHLREGAYTFQLTVTDAALQRSSDNVPVTVLPAAGSAPVGRNRKTETDAPANPTQPKIGGPSEDAVRDALLGKAQKAPATNQPSALSAPEKMNPSAFWTPESQMGPAMPDSRSSGKNRKEENSIFKSKNDRGGVEHPSPETGAVLPLALGMAITALLLLMVACRLRLVKQKLKKARPITSEESDYLINGMYL